MTEFVTGLAVGVYIGILIMCLMNANGGRGK